MKVMSSQHFRDESIIEEKIEMLKKNEQIKVVIPVINSYLQDLAGEDMYIVVDKHHEMSAAIELGLLVEFEEVEDTLSYCNDIENKNGEAICYAHYIDGDWYYVDVDEENGIGDLVW